MSAWFDPCHIQWIGCGPPHVKPLKTKLEFFRKLSFNVVGNVAKVEIFFF